jgi:hypothetical protein
MLHALRQQFWPNVTGPWNIGENFRFCRPGNPIPRTDLGLRCSRCITLPHVFLHRIKQSDFGPDLNVAHPNVDEQEPRPLRPRQERLQKLCRISMLKSSTVPTGSADLWFCPNAGSSSAPSLGSIAAEGSPRRTSTEWRSRSCASPQSASCSGKLCNPALSLRINSKAFIPGTRLSTRSKTLPISCVNDTVLGTFCPGYIPSSFINP